VEEQMMNFHDSKLSIHECVTARYHINSKPVS
jgi:hypothetical protein